MRGSQNVFLPSIGPLASLPQKEVDPGLGGRPGASHCVQYVSGV
jgi:hypothetical protein